MSNILKHIRNLVEYIPLLIFYHVVRLMPLKALIWFSKLCGWSIYVIPGFRRLIMANIRTAFPEYDQARAEHIARKSMANIARTMLEFFWFADSPARVEEYVVIHEEAKQKIAKHIANDERIIFVTPHIGNWEATGLKMSLSSGLKFSAVARPPRNPYINQLIRNSRKSFESDVIDAKGAVKNMLRAIRNGRSMATLIDQNTRVRDGGIFVNFFGLPVPSSRAPAIFARIPKVRVYVGGGLHTPDGKITTFLRELPKPEAEYTDDAEIIQDLISITEDIIREYPEQYLWMYKRFQYIPPDVSQEVRAKYPYYAATAPDKFFFKKR